MRTFSNNFSKLLLLSSNKVRFYDDEIEFFLNIPTLYDFYTNEDFMSLVNYLDKELEEINKIFNIKKLSSHYEFFNMMFILSRRIPELNPIRNSILKGMRLILPDFYFKDIMYINSEVPLTKKIFEDIVEILFISI
ncbi:hypothetical protein EOM09_08155, partial [bacterium]|nr:hypothetical protein [bacterium]